MREPWISQPPPVSRPRRATPPQPLLTSSVAAEELNPAPRSRLRERENGGRPGRWIPRQARGRADAADGDSSRSPLAARAGRPPRAGLAAPASCSIGRRRRASWPHPPPRVPGWSFLSRATAPFQSCIHVRSGDVPGRPPRPPRLRSLSPWFMLLLHLACPHGPWMS